VKVAKTPKAPKEPKVKVTKAPKAAKVSVTKAEGETPEGKDPVVMAKNKKTIAETMARINARKHEEQEAANALAREQAALEVDNFMADAPAIPDFLKRG
jgi:hypothetical protein